MSNSNRATKTTSGGTTSGSLTGRKPSNQIHFMGDFKGKVLVAPTGILRQDRTLKDQEADYLSRMEELNGHKRLLASLRERLTPNQLEKLITCDSPRRERQPQHTDDEQLAITEAHSSPPRYKSLDVSPTQQRGYSPDANFLLPLKTDYRGRGMASLISIIRTSLVMEGLLVNGPNGIQPIPQ